MNKILPIGVPLVALASYRNYKTPTVQNYYEDRSSKILSVEKKNRIFFDSITVWHDPCDIPAYSQTEWRIIPIQPLIVHNDKKTDDEYYSAREYYKSC